MQAFKVLLEAKLFLANFDPTNVLEFFFGINMAFAMVNHQVFTTSTLIWF